MKTIIGILLICIFFTIIYLIWVLCEYMLFDYKSKNLTFKKEKDVIDILKGEE